MKEVKNNRPLMHITGEKGWINDPNGLVVFQGEYHVFYQYYPDDTKWGPMHWGHVKSKDLVHWEQLPIALYPDENEWCFSGSAIVWQDKMWLLYTGHKENDGDETVVEQQCLAESSDGVHFIKHGVVIGNELLSPNYCLWGFRDPKIFRRNDKFYCVVATKRRSGKGRVILFKSDDLFHWEFCGDLFSIDSEGIMIECPDFNPDLNLMVYSQQLQPICGLKHRNLHSTYYCFGDIVEGEKFQYDSEYDIVDYGFDFYAPQTFEHQPVMIGWLNMWDRTNPSEKYGFAGQLSIPRKLQRKNGRLWQTPICDVVQVAENSNFTHLEDKFIVGKMTLDAHKLQKLEIKFRKKGESYASFKRVGDEWVFDRSKCGEQISGSETDEDSLNGVRRMHFDNVADTHIEVVSDLYSLEIFVNGYAMSSLVYPEDDADGLEISVSAESCTYAKFDPK